jgi:hypothetical protein
VSIVPIGPLGRIQYRECPFADPRPVPPMGGDDGAAAPLRE